MSCIEFRVRYSAGAYNCRHAGITASSTMSAQAAAERLASKVFRQAPQSVDHLGDELNGSSWWQAIGDFKAEASSS